MRLPTTVAPPLAPSQIPGHCDQRSHPTCEKARRRLGYCSSLLCPLDMPASAPLTKVERSYDVMDIGPLTS